MTKIVKYESWLLYSEIDVSQIFKPSRMEKGELIKLMLEYELFEEKIFWSSDSDFFQNYLEFLYLNGGKNDENDSGNKHSN